jgi:hypothetical protein
MGEARHDLILGNRDNLVATLLSFFGDNVRQHPLTGNVLLSIGRCGPEQSFSPPDSLLGRAAQRGVYPQ